METLSKSNLRLREIYKSYLYQDVRKVETRATQAFFFLGGGVPPAGETKVGAAPQSMFFGSNLTFTVDWTCKRIGTRILSRKLNSFGSYFDDTDLVMLIPSVKKVKYDMRCDLRTTTYK